MKTIALFWSGGLDSTYLLYKNLEEGNIVYAYYVRIENNNDKMIEELNSINKLKELFIEKYGDTFKYQDCITSTHVFGHTHDNMIFKQVPSFIYASLWIDSTVEELQLGYVMNDDAISYLSDIKNIYNSFNVIRDGHIPELVFPLTKINKQQEYYALPEKYRKHIWYCENPIDHKPCNSCGSCKRFNYNFPNHNSIDNDMSMKAEDFEFIIKG